MTGWGGYAVATFLVLLVLLFLGAMFAVAVIGIAGWVDKRRKRHG